jgi:hypothetical protein
LDRIVCRHAPAVAAAVSWNIRPMEKLGIGWRVTTDITAALVRTVDSGPELGDHHHHHPSVLIVRWRR